MTAVPITHPAFTRHQFRAQVCRLVDRLIGILDAIDGDGDLEPSLAHPEVFDRYSQAHSARTLPIGGPEWTDLEESCDDEGDREEDDDQVDGEASLSGTVGTLWQHAVGGQPPLYGIDTIDLEDQCEDEGAVTGDDEPEVHD